MLDPHPITGESARQFARRIARENGVRDFTESDADKLDYIWTDDPRALSLALHDGVFSLIAKIGDTYVPVASIAPRVEH
jgi:hypothetical protein